MQRTEGGNDMTFSLPSKEMTKKEKIRRLLDAMRTLRAHRALDMEQRRRGIKALTRGYLREKAGN